MNLGVVILLAALNGFLAVAFGAFAAHGLADAQAKAWAATGAHYQGLHALAMLAAAGVARAGGGPARFAVWAFLLGVLCFSGSLYALAFGAPRLVAALAPIGGGALLLGWMMMGLGGWALIRKEPRA